jgi:hypothetical protein
MGISPRIVAEDVVFLWDGAPQRLPKGQIIDVAPNSPLERAIGRHRLVPHGLPAASPPPSPPAETPLRDGESRRRRGVADLELPPEPAAQAKKQDSDGKEGDDS